MTPPPLHTPLVSTHILWVAIKSEGWEGVGEEKCSSLDCSYVDNNCVDVLTCWCADDCAGVLMCWRCVDGWCVDVLTVDALICCADLQSVALMCWWFMCWCWFDAFVVFLLTKFSSICFVFCICGFSRKIDISGDGEAVWHTDMSYVPSPPKASLMFSLEVRFNEMSSIWHLFWGVRVFTASRPAGDGTDSGRQWCPWVVAVVTVKHW
jgi:hypothetical protein